MRARVVVGLAVCALGWGVPGCGGSSSHSSAGAGPADTVRAYLAALGSRDWSAACARIAASTQRTIRQSAGGRSCPEVLQAALGHPGAAGDQALSALKAGRVGTAQLTGDHGAVPVSVAGLGTHPIEVVREAGAWKVARALGAG